MCENGGFSFNHLIFNWIPRKTKSSFQKLYQSQGIMELRGTEPAFKAVPHSFTCHKNVPGESRNPRLVWVGRDLKDPLIPTPCHGRDMSPCPRLLPALSSLAWDTARDSGTATAALGGQSPPSWEKCVPKETAPASAAESGGGRIRNVERHFAIPYTILTGLCCNSLFLRTPRTPSPWALFTGSFFHGITPRMQLLQLEGPKGVIPWDYHGYSPCSWRDPRELFHGITLWIQPLQLEGPKGVIPWIHPMDTAPAAGGDPRSPRSPPRAGVAAELGRNTLCTFLGSPRLEKPSKVPESSLCPTLPGTQPRALSATSSPGIQNWEFDLLSQLWLHLFCCLRSFLQPPSTHRDLCVICGYGRGARPWDSAFLTRKQHFTLILIPILDTNQHRLITKLAPNKPPITGWAEQHISPQKHLNSPKNLSPKNSSEITYLLENFHCNCHTQSLMQTGTF
ncbi:uncharacterized protein LOC134552402 [Prinia subflava]|uniref:uncharacterized protein LOC134552402 n=1 Tax=Prinia subflava TaxID=208062 RepID=UPI002FE42AD1